MLRENPERPDAKTKTTQLIGELSACFVGKCVDMERLNKFRRNCLDRLIEADEEMNAVIEELFPPTPMQEVPHASIKAS